jgi:DNA polymerase/3'-5' exonuclease PolX
MVSYNYALGIAQEFCEEIKDFCMLPTEIVGSLRRKRPQVNDIDILVIPRFEETPDDTLFGKITQINTLDSKLALMCFENQMKLETNGEKIKRFSNYSDSTIAIDLYIATKETLPTLRLIRTGSKEHNIKLCMCARDIGFHLNANGEGLFDAQLKHLKVENEEDIFRLLNLEYLPPEKRG